MNGEDLTPEELNTLLNTIATEAIKEVKEKPTEYEQRTAFKPTKVKASGPEVKKATLEAIKSIKASKKVLNSTLNIKDTLKGMDIKNAFDNMSMNFIAHYLKNPEESFEHSWNTFKKTQRLSPSEARAINNNLKPRIKHMFDQLDLSNPKYEIKTLKARVGNSYNLSGAPTGTHKVKNKVLFDKSKGTVVIPTTIDLGMNKENDLIYSLYDMFRGQNKFQFVGPKKKLTTYRVKQDERGRVGYKEKEQVTPFGNLGMSFSNYSPIWRNINKTLNGVINPERKILLKDTLRKYYFTQSKLKADAKVQAIAIANKLTEGMDYSQALKRFKNTTVGDLKHINHFVKDLGGDSLSVYELDDKTTLDKFFGRKTLYQIAKKRTEETRKARQASFYSLFKEVHSLTDKKRDNFKSYEKEIKRTLTKSGRPTEETFKTLTRMRATLKDKNTIKDYKLNNTQALNMGLSIKDISVLRDPKKLSQAAKVMLSKGIPESYKGMIAENMINTQGNTRKDFLTQVIRHTLNGTYSEAKATKALRFIGENLDPKTYKLIQDDKLLTLNNSLSRLMERSDTSSVKQMRKRLSFAVKNLSIGFEDNPENTKTMASKNSFVSGVDGVLQQNFVDSKYQKDLLNGIFGVKGVDEDNPFVLLEDFDKTAELKEGEKRKASVEKNTTGYHVIGGDNINEALDKVLINYGEATSVDKKALAKMMTVDPKLKTSELTRLLNKIKGKKASVQEVFQVVKLAKSLGMLSKNTDTTMGNKLYESAIKSLESLQAEYSYEKGFQSIGVNYNKSFIKDAEAFLSAGINPGFNIKQYDGFSDISALTKGKGLQLFENHEDPYTDIAYTRRQILSSFLGLSSTKEAKDLQKTLKSEMDLIVSGKATNIQRALTKEENQLALKLERLAAKAGGDMNGIDIKEASIPEVIDILNKTRYPERYLNPGDIGITRNVPRNIPKDNSLFRQYSKDYLKRVELKAIGATKTGKKVINDVLLRRLGESSIDSKLLLNRYIPKYKETIDNLVKIGTSKGIPATRLNKVASVIGKMSSNLQRRPLDYITMAKVLNDTDKLLISIGNGHQNKEIFDNPENTLGSLYSKNKYKVLKDVLSNYPRQLKKSNFYNESDILNLGRAGANSDLFFLKERGLAKDKEYAPMYATNKDFDFGNNIEYMRRGLIDIADYENFIEDTGKRKINERKKREKELIEKERQLRLSRILNFSRFATGGYIPGKSIRDEVPALLMKGEAVLNQDTVKSLGINNKEDFRRFESAAKHGRVKGFETGGLTEEEKKAIEEEKKNAKKIAEELNKPAIQDEVAKKLEGQTISAGTPIENPYEQQRVFIDPKEKNKKSKEPLFSQGGNREIPESRLLEHSLGKINLLNESKLDYKSLMATQKNINKLIPNTDLSEKQREKLAKLQRDLFVKSFEDNDPMKAIAQKIAKDQAKGKISAATEDAFNKLNSIQQESIKANLNSLATMKSFTKGLKKTTASTKDLSAHFKHLNSDTKTLSRMLGITQEEFNSLYKNGLGKKSVIDFINRLEKVNPQVSLAGANALQTQKIGNLYKSLSAINDVSNIDASNYGDLRATLDIHKKAVERKSYLQGSAESRFANFKEQMINNAAFMGSYAILGAGTAIIGAGLHTVVGLQDRLKNLQAITGSTNSEMVGLTGAIKHVAVNTKFSAAEISDAATVLGQAGYSANSIGTALSGVVKLATATGASLEDSTQTITSALTIWDKSFTASKDLANEFTAAVNKSKLDINSLGLALQYSGNIAAQGNIPVEDVLTLTALMKNAGIKRGSTLGTGQRLLFSDIIAPSAKFVKSLDRANISLTEFRKTFESKGVLGVFKFLKKEGYGFQDASRGMQIRERTAYAAIINQINKADAFKASIVGTTAAEDANKIQMSSTLNRAKNMVNSWGIALSEGTQSTLDNLGNLFRVFTLDNKQKSKKFIYNSKAQLDKNLHPVQDTAESFNTVKAVGLGVGLTGLGLLNGKAIKGFLTEGRALGKVATAAKDLGKSAKSLTSLSGALGAGKGLLGSLKSLGKYGGMTTAFLGPVLDTLDAANTYNKTKDSGLALRTFAADLLKDVLPTFGAALGMSLGAPTGIGGIVGGVTGYAGGQFLNEHLGINTVANAIAGKNTGTNQMRVIEQLASEGEAYKQFETNLAKSRKTLRKDKSLNILPEDTQSEKDLKNAMAFRKALALSIAYGPKISQINNTLQNTVENSVSLMKNITEGSDNVVKQLKFNMDAVAAASQKAREVKQGIVSDYLLNTKVKTKPTANMLDTISKFKNIDEFKRYILGGKETQSFLKLASVNPQLVTKNKDLIATYVGNFIFSSLSAYKGKGTINKQALTKALMDRISVSAFSGALGGTESQMTGYLNALKTSKGIPYAQEKIKTITDARNEKILERVGYTTFKSELNSIEADADKLGTTLSKTFKKINTTLQNTFVSESRRLGPQIQSFVNKMSIDSAQLFKEIKGNAAFKGQGTLENILGGKAGLTSFYNTNNQRLGKAVLDSGLYKTKAIGRPGYFNANADVTAESKALGLLDVDTMKKIEKFITGMKWPKDLKDAANLLQYTYAKTRNTNLINSGISESGLTTFNKLTNADVLNSLPNNRASFRDLFSKDYQAKIDFKKKIAIENMDIKVANIKKAKGLELENRFKAMDVSLTNSIAKMSRQFQYNLESISINASRSRRDAQLNYSQSVAAFNRKLDFQKENLNTQTSRSREDLLLSKNRQIFNLNQAADRNRQDLFLSLTRRTEALNKSYDRNLEKLNLSIMRQTELANINLARSRQQAYTNYARGVQDLNIKANYSREDARTNYNRQVESLQRNYERQVDAIKTAMSDTQALFARNLQKPVTLNVDGNALLKVANNLSDVSLALAANKAILNSNTSAIKQWININKTKEDVVKSAYKEAYKASGGNVNSDIFNSTYNDYLNKNSDKIIGAVVSQGLDKAFAGFDFDINKALTNPDYLKSQVANPGTSVSTEAAAVGNGVTSQTLVDALYGIQNGSYRTTTTEGAITQASGKLPAALFDLNTAMIKFNLNIRDAGTKLSYSLDDATKALSYSLTDISTNFERQSQALSLNLSRNLQDISTRFSQAMQDLQRQAEQQKEDLATSKSQAIEDLKTNFNNAITDLGTNIDRKMQDLNLKFDQGMEDITTTTGRKLEDLNNSATFSLNEMQINFNQTLDSISQKIKDMKDDLQRQLSFNINETLINNDQNKEAMRVQFNNLIHSLDLQNSQAKIALEKQVNDAFASATLDSLTLAHKFEKTWNDGLVNTTFNSIDLHNNLQESLDKASKGLADSTNILSKQIAGSISLLFKSPIVVQALKQMGYNSEEQVVSAFSHIDFSRLKQIILSKVQQLNQVSEAAANQMSLKPVSDSLKRVGNEVRASSNQTGIQIAQGSTPIVRGFQSLAQIVGNGAIQATQTISYATSQVIQQMTKQNRQISSLANSMFRNLQSTRIPGYTTGRVLPGYGGGDIIPTMLEPGEAIINKEAVRRFGADFFNALNKGIEVNKLISIPTAQVRAINNSNQSAGVNNYFNISIPVAPDATLNTIERNIPTIADKVKQVFEEYL